MQLKSNKKIITLFLVVAVGLLAVYVGLSYYKDQLRWTKYFRRTTVTRPNPLVAEHFNNLDTELPLTVLDLGFGNGSDTIFLLKKEHTVYAVDFHEEAFRRLDSNLDPKFKPKLHLVESKFQDLEWQQLPAFDVVLAINSLSFLKQREFNQVWEQIFNALKPGGTLIARLIGNKIKWPNMKNMTLLDKDAVLRLVRRYELQKLNERFYHEVSITQHAFYLVLRKPM